MKVLAKAVRDETGFPLVFIVDELDRCRPTFAVEVLERIKHLFNVPNIVFVIAVDRTQLEKSLKTVYGDIDVTNYLHRFFDFEFHLPDVNRRKFIDDRCKKHEINLKHNNITFNDVLANISTWHKLSLREIEQCIKCCTLILKNSEIDSQNTAFMTAILIVVKVKNRALYLKIINKKAYPQEISDFIVPPEYDFKMDKWGMGNFIDAIIYSSYRKEYFNQGERKKRLMKF